MDFLYQFIPVNIASALSWTLLHSIWQISLIGLALYAIRRFIAEESHAIKYWTALGALFSSLVVCLITFIHYFNLAASSNLEYKEIVYTLDINQADAVVGMGGFDQIFNLINSRPELIVFLWLMGFAFLMSRFIIGLYQTKAIKSSGIAIQDSSMLAIFNNLKGKMGINKVVGFAESKQINTAIVAGYWQPVILFPVCMLNQLSTDELKAIIAHELAHIKRNDFIVNLFQTVTELALYFHPVIWWVSNIINEEREICCDDLALSTTGNNHAYAKALVKLQEYKLNGNLPLALSFSGNKNEFKNRIFRILNQPIRGQLNRERSFAVASVLLIGLTFGYTEKWTNNNNSCDIEKCIEICEEMPRSMVEKRIVFISKDEQNKLSLDEEIIINEEIETDEDGLISLRLTASNFNNQDNQDKRIKVFKLDTFPGLSEKSAKEYKLLFEDHAIHLDSLLSKLNKSYQFNMDTLNLHFEHLEDLKIDSLFTHHFDHSNLQNLFQENQLNQFFESDRLQKLFEENELNHFFESNEWEELLEDGKLQLKKFEHGDILKYFDEHDFPMHFIPKHDFHGKTDLFCKRDFSEVVGSELLADGYINDGEEFKFEITGKYLKINGEKQPQNIWNKYSKLFEKHVGLSINNESKIVIESKARRSNKIFKSI